ncbi:Glycosyl transferases group 1 [Fibrobacter sp. UWR3]|uniref:glycosyltransferase n=1 Tax=Fibrobacter sp. UWR3 TaxID=1896217 RepID=UPI000912EB29|nr:glycosyltransferase [Fibrobacter sp. UWR3]SHN08014.1 Glycosyl transferases group 1 [Fibrobacter sp. UWR3]
MEKKLLFDLQVTQPQRKARFHGAGKYGIAIFKRLMQMAPDKLAVYYDENAYLDEDAVELIKKNNNTIYKSGKISVFDAARREGGVLYVPMIGAHIYPYPPKDIQFITTQHDLRHFILKRDLYYPVMDDRKFAFLRFFAYKVKDALLGYYQRKKIFSRIENFLNRDNVHFVTVSEYSKKCFLKNCPNIQSGKVKVCWAPSTIDTALNIDELKNEYGKYWLLVGVNRYEKNGARAIKTFDKIFSEYPEISGRVIVTGLARWNQIRMNVKNKNRFSLLGYVDERKLKALYHFAYAFVYPTLSEGFGYPPVEAMHEGCPVITSAVASVPEVCGQSVIYFNPYSINDMKKKILMMENAMVRQEYAKKSKMQYNTIRSRQDDDLTLFCNYILAFLE